MTDLSVFRGPDFKTVTDGGIGKKKPKQRSHATREHIAEVRESKCKACRLCKTTVNVNAHHLIARGMGGAPGGFWNADNVLGLCGHGNTDGCHGLVENHEPAACYALRATLTDSEYAYVVSAKGEGWLEYRYPVGTADPAPLPRGETCECRGDGCAHCDYTGDAK